MKEAPVISKIKSGKTSETAKTAQRYNTVEMVKRVTFQVYNKDTVDMVSLYFGQQSFLTKKFAFCGKMPLRWQGANPAGLRVYKVYADSSDGRT